LTSSLYVLCLWVIREPAGNGEMREWEGGGGGEKKRKKKRATFLPAQSEQFGPCPRAPAGSRKFWTALLRPAASEKKKKTGREEGRRKGGGREEGKKKKGKRRSRLATPQRYVRGRSRG